MNDEIEKAPFGVKSSLEGWNIYSVNGTAARNFVTPSFSKISSHKTDPCIPENEIWVDAKIPWDDIKEAIAAEEEANKEVPQEVATLPQEAAELSQEPEPPVKVSAERFWEGLYRGLDKQADWVEGHQEEVARGMAAAVRSRASDIPSLLGKEEPKTDRDMLSWLFEAGEKTVLDKMRDMADQQRQRRDAKSNHGANSPNKIPTGDNWGRVGQSGSNQGGSAGAVSGPDSLLSNPSGWSR